MLLFSLSEVNQSHSSLMIFIKSSLVKTLVVMHGISLMVLSACLGGPPWSVSRKLSEIIVTIEVPIHWLSFYSYAHSQNICDIPGKQAHSIYPRTIGHNLCCPRYRESTWSCCSLPCDFCSMFAVIRVFLLNRFMPLRSIRALMYLDARSWP